MQIGSRLEPQLQEPVEHLNCACWVIALGRAFLHCLYDAMAGLDFNGVSFWRADLLFEAELEVHSDAVGGWLWHFLSGMMVLCTLAPRMGFCQGHC